jgi:hypothetical protein
MKIFEPIFEALNQVDARYVVVGGLATIVHGYIRLTRDADLVVDLTPADATRTIRALETLGFRPTVPVAASDFADPAKRAMWARDKHMVVFSMRSSTSPIVVDLFVEYPMDFDDLWQHAEVLPLGTTSIRVASLEDLIHIKRMAGRPKDLADVEELERIRTLRTSEGL